MITKLEADKLVEKYETFYQKEITPKGCEAKVYVYNYLLSDKEAFKDPKARELRGLTIVKENAKEKVFLSIPKFFNINELPETQENVISLKKIKKVQDKLDGSMIQPIELCNEIKMKTKQSFTNPQAKLAQEILDDSPDLQFFILDCWANDFFPMFELVSPLNKIVLDYDETKLVLTAVRCQSGDFVDIDKFDYPHRAEAYDYTIEEMINMAQSTKDTEGFVVKFHDGQIIKIKTLDYISKHRIVSDADQYKVIFQKILTETLDDVYPLLSVPRANEIRKIEQKVQDYVVHYIKQINDIIKDGDPNNRAKFARAHREHIYFSVIMKCLKGYDPKEVLVDYLLRKYSKEAKTREFLESI